jgi:hypothetical protein
MEEKQEIIHTLDELIEMNLEGKLPEGQLLFECYLSEEKKALNSTDKVHRDLINREKWFRKIYTQSASAVGFRGIKTRA